MVPICLFPLINASRSARIQPVSPAPSFSPNFRSISQLLEGCASPPLAFCLQYKRPNLIEMRRTLCAPAMWPTSVQNPRNPKCISSSKTLTCRNGSSEEGEDFIHSQTALVMDLFSATSDRLYQSICERVTLFKVLPAQSHLMHMCCMFSLGELTKDPHAFIICSH